jgi:hypothetical protein
LLSDVAGDNRKSSEGTRGLERGFGGAAARYILEELSILLAGEAVTKVRDVKFHELTKFYEA